MIYIFIAGWLASYASIIFLVLSIILLMQIDNWKLRRKTKKTRETYQKLKEKYGHMAQAHDGQEEYENFVN